MEEIYPVYQVNSDVRQIGSKLKKKKTHESEFGVNELSCLLYYRSLSN